MLITVLVAVIVALIFVSACVTGLCLKNMGRAMFWEQRFVEERQNYAALEKGRDEESESYEQQYLSFMETIENQSNAIGSYIDDLHFLADIVVVHSEDRETLDRVERIKQAILLAG